MISASSTGPLHHSELNKKPMHLAEQQARQRLAGYGRFKCITICFQEGVLTVTGRVPTYYLKQVLQTLLKNLDGVNQVDNRVEVVSSPDVHSQR